MKNTYPYYQEIRAKIEDAAKEDVDKSEIFWAIADSGTALIDTLTDIPIFNVTTTIVQELYSLINDHPVMPVPNPWFVWNQHDDNTSPETIKYLQKRGYVSAASSAIAIAGAGGALVTCIDLGVVGQGGAACASTMKHLAGFRDIAAKYKESATIQSWLDVLITMKNLKLAVRGGQVSVAVLSAVPVLSTALSIIGSSLSSAAKLGINLKYSNVCRYTAMDLRWRAMQETILLETFSRGKDDSGPARTILFELFERKGLTGFVWGKHHVDQLIKEPAGWMAIADKLLII
ncbi:hypothetical protein FVI83_23690 [Salmonella enterica subsp. diarizonae]|uniref:Uncharacterized protein n=1 Tax=Salmonella enterica subsp. arizonae TaxID=59203 RepID=A0A447R2D1_SALER|nr:hypothetical protein [Salmonella enterica]ECG8513157.1 hypothetical protein [Salmonella enterica subsp. diarizonae]VEA76437.1 Uncharacterised protein [Salmonella enterica subsp. arizonae]ECJ2287585.1 hypothetical protein [Salmonella enterica subsp. diarizonae]ECJ2332686.1 hypothetical protein [Salmonella enterica subsp. diarizonae]ECJ2471860.1 hypothetical protein [Salmonella enterica subsp. diarizonae]